MPNAERPAVRDERFLARLQPVGAVFQLGDVHAAPEVNQQIGTHSVAGELDHASPDPPKGAHNVAVAGVQLERVMRHQSVLLTGLGATRQIPKRRKRPAPERLDGRSAWPLAVHSFTLNISRAE